MADISQIKLPNNTVLDIKDTTARATLADMSKVHVIELESQETIDNDSVYISEVTNNEVKTMVDNGELVILKLGGSFFYFYGYDRGVAYLTFFGGEERDRLIIRPYQYNNAYTNYWQVINAPQIYWVYFRLVEVEDENGDTTMEWRCDRSINEIISAYQNDNQIVVGYMQYYSQKFITTKVMLDSLDGYHMYFHFEDKRFIYVLSLASSTINFKTIYIPIPEDDENVNAMLTNMGLSTTAYFNQATVGTAEPEHSIVQDVTQ